jgi:hypothetical protein
MHDERTSGGPLSGSVQLFGRPSISFPRLVIGICSAQGMRERRDAVRETWLHALPPGITAVFFVGAADLDEPGVVCLPVPDDYHSLSIKVHAFYCYALRHLEFDFLFKCDDDTYVHAERLAALARPGVDFVGSKQLDTHGFASGGAGYLMSRSLVEDFVSEPVTARCDEDVLFSSRVQKSAVRCESSDALQGFGAPVPEFWNAVVTGHWCPPPQMRRIHAGLTGSEHGAIVVDLRATHRVWSGVVRLFADGVFWSRGPDAPNGSWQSAEDGNVLLLRWYYWPADTLHLHAWGFGGSDLQLEFTSNVDWSRWTEICNPARSLAR